MLKKILNILFVSVLFCKLQAQTMPTGTSNYKNNLTLVISKIYHNDIVSLSKIEKTIPTKLGDYFSYYSSTYSDIEEDKVKAFYKLDSIIYTSAKLNKLNFTKKVIRMADFVDGEYAEAYFENLEEVVKLNTKCFCKEYLKLNEDGKDRLKELYSQHCN